MEKKTYSKPVMVKEKFVPQEYCEVCVSPGNEASFGNYNYVDFNNDGTWDSNESVGTSGSTTYTYEGRITVNVYKFERYNRILFFGSWGNPNEDNVRQLNDSCPYGGQEFGGESYGFLGEYRYRLNTVSSGVTMLVSGNQIYNNFS